MYKEKEVKRMNKLLLVSLLFILSVTLVGCGGVKSGISGKYLHEDDPESYLELYSDGTFYLYYDAGLDFGTRTGFRGGLDGTYRVKNDTIILSSTLGAAKFWIGNGKLRDEQNNYWLKEGKHAEGKAETISQETEIEDVIKAYIDSWVNIDFEAFKNLTATDSLDNIPSKEEFEEGLISGDGKWIAQNLKEFEATKIEIEDNIVKVEGIFFFKQKSSTYPDGIDPSVVFLLAKEENHWKMIFKEPWFAADKYDAAEAAKNELNNIQNAVIAMMTDNELKQLPDPVDDSTYARTRDMSQFPDRSAIGTDKVSGPTQSGGTADYQSGDKVGYILYQHDIYADNTQTDLVNYVARRNTTYWYSVDTLGTVTQYDSAN
jgi:hypothetical protein